MTTTNSDSPVETPAEGGEAPVVPEAAPAVETPAAPVETPAEGGEAIPGEGPGEGLIGDDEKKFSQKDLNRIEAKNKGRDRRENRELRDRVARLEGVGSVQTPAPTAPKSSFAEPEPQQENYDTEAEHLKAVGSWSVRKEHHDIGVASQASAAGEAVAALKKEFYRKVDSSDIYEKHPDFDEVLADSGGIFCNDLMEEMITTSDHTADIAYHLASNPAEVDRIGQMGPVQAAKAIAGLEVKFAAKPLSKKNISNAPTPISPVDGNDGVKGKDPSKMTDAEYRRARENGEI